ncbi:radical SAM/SPASM family putative metalloenzyme maturase [Desulfovibrio sp. TomC]|uniref:radical SAM/SPASM family putative metalloenzyme maturase n=1 Tax=Desulfovibrio sp. TomC TaxID=1562888 RepID=UPI000574B3B8|nr:radical SAM/SPASM family putative metalloenzyme maturase [Desulfovibrio sp. TomC]KHK00395.1 Radical SAM domain protein [Desulfovibrio sp. TomC]
MTSVDNPHEDLSQGDHPSRLFVEVTSRCNLRCAICVKQSGAAKSIDGDMLSETFNALAPEFKHLQALVLNGIGEPLLHPLLEEFIRTGKRLMPAQSWVGFQTNGHLLDTARCSSLIAAGLDRIFLSVDSTSPELFKAVRNGGSLGHVERALAALAQAKKEHPGNALEVGAEFVVMRDNIAELPAIIAWLAKRGVTKLVVSHVLPFSSTVANQTVFGINTNSAKYFYQAWSDRARQEGINITQYFNVLWKYHKTPQDLRLVSFVQRMVSQALENDIPLHVANLTDGDDVGPVEAVFRKAEAVADAVGLRLLLPSVRPVSGHACLGVKQGGAFIAWDGKVSPCHFLWRSFNCYFYGREKQVAHKVFGDLSKDSLSEIWNRSNYKAFRADVMHKRYPHCPGCNVYPCEDINSIDFEYDCYGETVPCGDCLWSMGLLQCMGQEDEFGEFHDCCDGIQSVDKFEHTAFGVPAQA